MHSNNFRFLSSVILDGIKTFTIRYSPILLSGVKCDTFNLINLFTSNVYIIPDQSII